MLLDLRVEVRREVVSYEIELIVIEDFDGFAHELEAEAHDDEG